MNVIGELPASLSKDLTGGLLGPNPTGRMTILPLTVIAFLCFRILGGKVSRGDAEKPKKKAAAPMISRKHNLSTFGFILGFPFVLGQHRTNKAVR